VVPTFFSPTPPPILPNPLSPPPGGSTGIAATEDPLRPTPRNPADPLAPPGWPCTSTTRGRRPGRRRRPAPARGCTCPPRPSGTPPTPSSSSGASPGRPPARGSAASTSASGTSSRPSSSPTATPAAPKDTASSVPAPPPPPPLFRCCRILVPPVSLPGSAVAVLDCLRVSWSSPQVTFRDAEAATKACEEPSPVIDGRRANCNLASLGRAQPSTPLGIILF
uniref:Uncharacterized protein n=1 Tax=Aegilops tauschii subsp. strangulata TaxID=200361 RepID=A0A453PE29_AEGTS